LSEERAADVDFKDSLIEVLTWLEGWNALEVTSFDARLALANLSQWLHQTNDFSVDERKKILETARSYYSLSNNGSPDSSQAKDLIQYFLPKYHYESLVGSVFTCVDGHLTEIDNRRFLRGMEQFLVYTMKSSINAQSFYKLGNLSLILKKFEELLTKEISTKGEMSFDFSTESGAQIKLTNWEIYRIFLMALAQILFTDKEFKDYTVGNIVNRLLFETNIDISGKLMDYFVAFLKAKPTVHQKIKNLQADLKKASEDEQENIQKQIKTLLISVFDRLELQYYLKRYDMIHRNTDTLMDESTGSQVDLLIAGIKNDPHFTIYSVFKLLEFKPTIFFTRPELTMFITEMNETTKLLTSEELQIPDDEIRFFVDRVLLNTKQLRDFGKMTSIFRANIRNQERYRTIHELLEENRMSKKHASALMSFYLAAMLEVNFGDSVAMPDIEEIANRLGSTFSITRRFEIAQDIERILRNGELDGKTTESWQREGRFLEKIQEVMNRRELDSAFDQYLNMKLFFDDYPENADKQTHQDTVKKLVGDVWKKMGECIDKSFADVLNAEEDEAGLRELLRYAQNKISTLIGQDLDRGRRDKTVEKVARDQLMEMVENFSSDARSMYEQERQSRAINIADLYTDIQKQTRMISIVLGDISNELDNWTAGFQEGDTAKDFEEVKLILGGVAVFHRDGQLNFQATGVKSMLDLIAKTPEQYEKLILGTIQGEYGHVEIKDENGKTKTVNTENFGGALQVIGQFPPGTLLETFKAVFLSDLLRELFDAFNSSRGMAKNSRELKTALDDIKKRSSDLLKYIENRYNQMLHGLHKRG
jgi:hypothetical protein